MQKLKEFDKEISGPQGLLTLPSKISFVAHLKKAKSTKIIPTLSGPWRAREYVKRRQQKCHLPYDSERMYCVSLEKYVTFLPVECRIYSKNVLRKESKLDLRNHNLLRHCF